MAIKKKTKKKSSRSKGSKMLGLNINEAMGIFGMSFAEKSFLDGLIPDTVDPRLRAAGKFILGSWFPKQKFAKGMLNSDMLEGAGASLKVHGADELLGALGVAGFEEDVLGEDDYLAVAVEGIDDIYTDDGIGADDDLDVVSEDVLGDDEEDEM